MNTEIKIVKMECRPYLDPYQRDIGQFTRTRIWLDPEAREVWVDQAEKSGSWSMEEHHSLIVGWTFATYMHPNEEQMAAILDGYMDDFKAICHGFKRVWDGNNHVGRYNDVAQDAKWRLEREIAEFFVEGGYVADTLDDWIWHWKVDTVDWSTTDEQLAELATMMHEHVKKNLIVLDNEDILGHITEYRDQERAIESPDYEYEMEITR